VDPEAAGTVTATTARARPFRSGDGGDAGALLDLVTANAAARGALRTYLMNSDLAWQYPGSVPEDNVRLWWQGDRLLAYAWFQPPDELKFDLRTTADALAAVPGGQALFGDILRWALGRRLDFEGHYPFYLDLESMTQWRAALEHPATHPLAANRYLFTTALDDDQERRAWLAESGFAATRHFEPIMVRSLEGPLRSPAPPAGFRVRHVEEADLEQRVALHRAAWAPASGFDLARYLEIRAMREVFDPEFDLVAVAPDGTLASYTIAWRDDVSSIGSIEPFGTRPEFRGTRASEAVMHEALRRLAAKGMTEARVYTAGFNRPAQRLYERCGFQVQARSRTYSRQVTPAGARPPAVQTIHPG
jgi:ribosomal protein S18 acetylase RimI-like enzyme